MEIALVDDVRLVSADDHDAIAGWLHDALNRDDLKTQLTSAALGLTVTFGYVESAEMQIQERGRWRSSLWLKLQAINQ
jgi:hypothetical protein